MRLIDADAAKKVLESKSDMATGTPKKVFAHVVKMLDLLTTIEAEPVRHGEWAPYPSDQYRKCSVCGIEYAKFEMLLKHKYCPNCGAKMDGKEEEKSE